MTSWHYKCFTGLASPRARHFRKPVCSFDHLWNLIHNIVTLPLPIQCLFLTTVVHFRPPTFPILSSNNCQTEVSEDLVLTSQPLFLQTSSSILPSECTSVPWTSHLSAHHTGLIPPETRLLDFGQSLQQLLPIDQLQTLYARRYHTKFVCFDRKQSDRRAIADLALSDDGRSPDTKTARIAEES